MLQDLYQELIIDHGTKPRNFGSLEQPCLSKQGHNPLCGDQLTVYIIEKNGIIEDIKFEGEGCAISMASASLMCQGIKGLTIEKFEQIFQQFHQCLTTDAKSDSDILGKAEALLGVKQYPMRVKCATLAWHTLRAALNQDDSLVSTE